MQRPWVKAAVAVAALVIVLLVLTPFLIRPDSFRPLLESQLSSALGRNVALGRLSFSVFSGSLVAENITISDDPAFSTSPFLKAKSLAIGVETGPMIFHRKVRIVKLTLDSPSVQLIQTTAGTWNFSSIGGASANPAPQQLSTLPDLTVGELKIKNGSATLSSLPATGKQFVCTGITVGVQQFSFAKSFQFQLAATLQGGGSFQLNGAAGPLDQRDAAKTPFQATLQLKHFDPVAAGVVDPARGISMVVDIGAQIASDGTALTSAGNIHADRLQLARSGSPSPKPVDIDYSVSGNLQTRIGQLSSLSVHTGSVAVSATGTYRTTDQGTVVDVHLSAPNVPIDQLEHLLPAAGVTLPSGSRLQGGALTANLAITGLATTADIAGPVEITNTRLEGFDLGSKIQGLNPFGGNAGGTSIQTLRATVNSSVQSTQFTNIYAELPQVGTASGSGTVSAAGALDFHLAAKFNPSTGVGAVAGKAVNAVGGFLGRALRAKTNNGIPITLAGTAKSPSIHANLAALL